MEIKTSRLNIKDLHSNDLKAIHELHSYPQVDKFNTLGIPENIKSTEVLLQEWLNALKAKPRILYVFRIEFLETKEFVGLIALNLGKQNFKLAEVWYKICPNYWNKGITTEALLRIIQFGFYDLKLHRIEAGCAVENFASIKVLEKAGMVREGIKRKILPIRGNWVDNYFYSILDSDKKRA